MGVGSRIFLLLCFVIKLSIYSSVFPPKHDPRCAREEFQHWHAIFPESAAHSCLPLQPPMVDSSCIRGFVTNGSVPRAECCLMKTATENASRWVNFHGNPCVKSQTEVTTLPPTQTQHTTTTLATTPASPNTSHPSTETPSKSTTHSSTTKPSTTHASTATRASTTYPSSATSRPSTTTRHEPWFTVTPPHLRPGPAQNVSWMKSNCLLFFASEIIFEFKWKDKSYMFNSTLLQKEMRPLTTNMSCSGSKHTVQGGWSKQSDNITFAVTFQKNTSSWYATRMQHNVSDLRAQFDFHGTYFNSPMKSAYQCGHSVYRSNSEDASITFRNIKVQAFEVNGMNFSTDMVGCSDSTASKWTTEMTVLIVCISVGSVFALVIIAYLVIRCSRSKYDFLK